MSIFSETATVNIVNNSGRSIDAIALFHWSALVPQQVTDAGPPQVPTAGQIIPIWTCTNFAVGSQQTQASLVWGAPLDYWECAVLFEGDGTTYLMTGNSPTYYPYVEFEVDSGTTITFTINQYLTGATNQSDITIGYSDGSPETAHLMNPSIVTLAQWATALVTVVAHVKA
jgi:hypothetical protein